LDIDLCAEQSHTGGCAVVNGATEAETGGRGLKDESEPPTASLVVVFYRKKT